MSTQSTCCVCFDDLDDCNSVLYKISELSDWFKANICITCTLQLRATLYEKYCTEVETTKCAKTAKTLINRGPPVNIYDRYAFPETEGSEVHSLKLISDEIISAKLDNSLVGEARLAYWLHLKHFYLPDET